MLNISNVGFKECVMVGFRVVGLLGVLGSVCMCGPSPLVHGRHSTGRIFL